MAHNIAIARLGEERALPECRGQRLKTQRGEESFAVMNHSLRVNIFRLECCIDIRSRLRVCRGQQRINIIPLLRPHVAEEMRGNRGVFRHYVLPVFLSELPANVRVQRNVKWADLRPQSVEFLAEIIRRHVVIGAPHRANVRKSHFLRALIAEFDEARISLTHWGSDSVPPLPGSEQFLWITAFGKDFLDVGKLLAVFFFVIRTPRALAVVAIK